ncbi:MAG: hypothetical protein ACK5MN_02795 [Lachnospiraceae bacterium]
MDKLSVQRLAYLYLANEKDRKILLEEEKMKFYDFRKYTYLTDLIGFKSYNIYLWNRYSSDFNPQFEALEKLLFEEPGYAEDTEFAWEEQDRWVEEFCKEAPSGEEGWLRKLLQKRIQEKLK